MNSITRHQTLVSLAEIDAVVKKRFTPADEHVLKALDVILSQLHEDGIFEISIKHEGSTDA